ncbi:MAG: hypothetical protein LN411_06195, partial [Candidatus Thermoplasmatota archaeon]|nr:hypothetical protein [Candidatus Thermoplasmatota archaeon]
MMPPVAGSTEEPMRLAAREEAKRLISEHRCVPVEDDAKKEVLLFLAKYDKEMIGSVVPTDYLNR